LSFRVGTAGARVSRAEGAIPVAAPAEPAPPARGQRHALPSVLRVRRMGAPAAAKRNAAQRLVRPSRGPRDDLQEEHGRRMAGARAACREATCRVATAAGGGPQMKSPAVGGAVSPE